MAAAENETPAWCYYNNDPSNGAVYGKLYNWFALKDSRGLAPLGWHLPSDQEWTLLINALDEIQLAALPFAADQGSEIRDLGFIDFTISISQSHALVVGWQEGVSIVLGAAGRTDADKSRDALVLGPEAIEDPRSYTRTYKLARAGVHSDCGLGVGRHLGLHRIDDEHVIGNFSQFREQIRNPQSALASLLEFPGRLHPFASAPRTVLPVGLGQFRLVVESIDVGRTTSHVEEDDPLGLGWEMGTCNPCCSIGEPLFGQKCREC
jgi:hypothetical protein